jgi:xanthine dehydrogenase accessory factor
VVNLLLTSGVKIEREINKKIQEIIEKNIPAYLITVTSAISSAPVRLGERMIIYPALISMGDKKYKHGSKNKLNLLKNRCGGYYTDGKIHGTVGGGNLEKTIIDYVTKQKPLETIKLNFDLTKDGLVKMICGGSVEVLVERLHNPYLLYIIGAGHCGIELSRLAKSVGFYVIVIDNRKEWANKEKHPLADDIIVAHYKNIEKNINFTDNTYIVIMTHNHEYDEEVLKKCLKKRYKYLGMIGSRNKVSDCFKRLTKQGFSQKELSKVFAPIGFAIGSITPSEIAISIMAQIIAVKNNIQTIPFNSNPLSK